MNEPQNYWVLTAPGEMTLTNTNYVISWDGRGNFFVFWNGEKIGSSGTSAGAKDHAAWHLRELLAMGLEP